MAGSPSSSGEEGSVTEQIRIFINGQNHEIDAPTSLNALLRKLKIDLKYIAIALNEEVIPRPQTSEKMIQNGDRIEIIKAVAGG